MSSYCADCGNVGAPNEANVTALNEQFRTLIDRTFHEPKEKWCEPRVLSIGHEPLYSDIVRRIDPKGELFTLIAGTQLEMEFNDSKALKDRRPGSLGARFVYEGFTYLILSVRQGDQWHRYMFYHPDSTVVKLIRQIRRWSRSAPTVYIYDNGNEYLLREIKKLPFVTPSSTMAVWNQYIHPQLELKQPYNHVVFHGPPGCGKTAFTRWVATKYPKWKFIFVGPSSVTKPGHISSIFEFARRRVPAVLIFEDIDLIGKHRMEMSQAFDPMLGELLNNLDGVEPNQNLLAIASTNNLPALDPAVTRPGRLGIHMGMSYTVQEKADILYNYYKPSIMKERSHGFVEGAIFPLIKDVDTPAKLKMIAKLCMIFEEFEHHKLTLSKFAEIVKTIQDERQIPTVIESDNEDDDKPVPAQGATVKDIPSKTYVS